MNVKVAIRVRPFNQRELDMGEKACVGMEGNSIQLLTEKGDVERNFSYDYCFWSHDGFRTLPNGYNEPESPQSKYADQRKVYDAVGRDLLGNALKGYNCCLFAYGQTGSGKSYSIFGYGPNRGVVPIICDELLNGKTLVRDEKHSFTLSVSMLEIYNEKIQDLLVPIAHRPKGGLQIRENPRIGVFVENLSKYAVKSYSEIEEIINSGNKNKTLAATLMNATSSRAHTIITLELVQKEATAIKSTEKTSIINLVDLAGSEKVAKTDAQGDRLKEACSINKSLTTLGMVIHQLYLKSEGEKTIVSYRDSALTRMLQTALGGNSKTTMICAVSPARDNYDETLSTLRYADQAKRIKLDAKINESETDKLIRELIEENEKLKKLLSDVKSGKGAALDQIQENIDEIQSALNLRKATKFDPSLLAEQDLNPAAPNLVNLNEDPLLSGKVVYNLAATPRLVFGRAVEEAEKSGEKRIVLNAVGIQTHHAVVELLDGKVWLEACDAAAAENVFLNGELLSPDAQQKFRVALKDADRLIIGTSTTFLLRVPPPGVASAPQVRLADKLVDWEFCQMEKFKSQEKKDRERFQHAYEEKQIELAATEEKLKKQFEAEKAAYEEKLKKANLEFEMALASLEGRSKELEKSNLDLKKLEMEDENQDALRMIEGDLNKKQQEFQQKLASLQKESEAMRQAQVLNEQLEKKLIAYYPQVKEANAIARELQRNISFVPFVSSLEAPNAEGKAQDLLFNVKVINQEEGWVNFWNLEKFESRLELMREAIDCFFDYNTVPYKVDNDPFWDPKEFLMFGQGIFIAKNVLYRFSLEHKVSLISYEGELGYAAVRLVPIDEEGKPVDEAEMEELVEEPDDLIKNKLPASFRIEIERLVLFDACSLAGKICNLQFEVRDAKGLRSYSTNTFHITDVDTPFNYSQTVHISTVDFEIIDYYLHKNILLKLMIDEVEHIPVLGKNPLPTVVPKKPMAERDKIPSPPPHPAKQPIVRKVSLFKEKTNTKKNAGCNIF